MYIAFRLNRRIKKAAKFKNCSQTRRKFIALKYSFNVPRTTECLKTLVDILSSKLSNHNYRSGKFLSRLLLCIFLTPIITNYDVKVARV